MPNKFCIALLLSCLSWHSISHAGASRNWLTSKTESEEQRTESCEELSKEQRQALIAKYYATQDEDAQQDLKQRFEWFCQLSDAEQQHLRFAWQSMNSKERQELKQLLQNTQDPEQRRKIRQSILQKYPLPD